MRISAYAGTDVGRAREQNEDNLYSGSTVFAVADGMGGHRAGEVASETALRPIAELDGRSFADPTGATGALKKAIEAANHIVVGEAESNPSYSGMGTTLTAVMVRDGKLHLAHVGDSRAYLLRHGEDMDQLTTDHTLVEELVQDGRLSRDEVATHPQRSVITRAVGVDREGVEVDTLPPLVLQPGDQVLLCSDGLTGPVSDGEIAEILTATTDGNEAVRRLLAAANEHGGPDNITVVLLRVEDIDGDGAGTQVRSSSGEAADATVALGGGTATAAKPSIAIRTRPASASGDWARDMGRLGDRQGVDPPPSPPRRRRGRRALAVLVSVLVLLAVVGAGAYLVLSRAFFLGEDAGRVAVFNGLPQEAAGIPLYRLRESSDLPLADLPAHIQDVVRDGLTVASLAEARSTIAAYREQYQDRPATADQPADGDEPAGADRAAPAATETAAP